MNIVILGASGMIGLYLVDELLKDGHHIIATGRNDEVLPYFRERGIPYVHLDVSKAQDFKLLPQSNVDVVVHLAAIMPATMKGYEPNRYFEINTLGTLNALEYCKKVGAKQILYTQSHSDMGGYWGQKKPINPYLPYSILYGNDHTVYIISKIAALELIKHYHVAAGLSYAVFRCPNIYSYHPNQFFYVDGKRCEVGYRKMIRQALRGETLEIWGDCKIQKDIVYVKDLTQMMLKAIHNKIQAGIYNVSTGKRTSLEEQVLGIAEVFSPTNKPCIIKYRPEKKVQLNQHHYSIKNAKKDLGYKPAYSYKKMLEDMKKEMESKRFDCLKAKKYI
ncbi:NAD-dependent epimerase/dehydratase family protein [Candidatus Avelusimicrobium alvi]|uniref:NAD-dependent epimerase/dehydratase family protein n=1 Tax=Candidatus Avelusimicrobium alvi TaxID=3416221 RepID=UPI003D10A3E7